MAGTSRSGRKPKPTALKVVGGNPGKRKLPTDEPKPPKLKANAKPPAGMTKEARKAWPRVIKILVNMKVFTMADTDAVRMYCENFARWEIATKEIATRSGMVELHPTSGALVVSPYHKIAKECEANMFKIMTEFGMTPSSRTRVKIEKPPGEDDDGFDDL